MQSGAWTLSGIMKLCPFMPGTGNYTGNALSLTDISICSRARVCACACNSRTAFHALSHQHGEGIIESPSPSALPLPASLPLRGCRNEVSISDKRIERVGRLSFARSNLARKRASRLASLALVSLGLRANFSRSPSPPLRSGCCS